MVVSETNVDRSQSEVFMALLRIIEKYIDSLPSLVLKSFKKISQWFLQTWTGSSLLTIRGICVWIILQSVIVRTNIAVFL